MPMTLRDKIESSRLLLRIFLRVTPYHLYSAIFVNSLKNLLHIYNPFSVGLGLTYRCQYSCQHCSAGLYKKDVNKELTTKEWLSLLDEVSDLGVPRINITGGESLLRNDIFEIVGYASKKFIVILESNGRLITEENAKLLKKAKVSCVAVSIDSYLPDVHDSRRGGKGYFQKAVEGITYLSKHNVPCLLSTYITSQEVNRDYINSIISLARRLNVIAVRVIPPFPIGNYSYQPDYRWGKENEEKLLRYLDFSIAYFKLFFHSSRCSLLSKGTFYISPYGELQPCSYLPISFGIIGKTPLPSMLRNMWDHPIFRKHGEKCFALNGDFRKEFIEPFMVGDNKVGLPIKIDLISKKSLS